MKILENPLKILTDTDVMYSKASADFERTMQYIDPLVSIGLDMLKSLNKADGAGSELSGSELAGLGIEAEGGEIVESGNSISEIVGNSHEQGGVPIALPGKNSRVYSNRVKIEGEEISKRKKKRIKQIKDLERKLEQRPFDKALKNAYKRMIEIDKQESEKEMQLQNTLRDIAMSGQGAQQQLPAKNMPMFGLGGDTWPPDPNLDTAFYPTEDFKEFMDKFSETEGSKELITLFPWAMQTHISTDGVKGKEIPINKRVLPEINTNLGVGKVPNDAAQEAAKISDRNKIGLTVGDVTGLLGQYLGVTKPFQILERNRAGDKATPNFYKDYGVNGINKIEQSKRSAVAYTESEKAQADNMARQLIDNTLLNTSSSATGVANMLAAYRKAADYKSKISNNLLNTLANTDKVLASLLTDRDAKVMGGERAAYMQDEANRDNYFSELAKAWANVSTGLQHIGKNVNQVKQRNVTTGLINDMSKYFSYDTITGKFSKKQNISLQGSDKYEKILNGLDKDFLKAIGISQKDWAKLPTAKKFELMLKYT